MIMYKDQPIGPLRPRANPNDPLMAEYQKTAEYLSQIPVHGVLHPAEVMSLLQRAVKKKGCALSYRQAAELIQWTEAARENVLVLEMLIDGQLDAVFEGGELTFVVSKKGEASGLKDVGQAVVEQARKVASAKIEMIRQLLKNGGTPPIGFYPGMGVDGLDMETD